MQTLQDVISENVSTLPPKELIINIANDNSISPRSKKAKLKIIAFAIIGLENGVLYAMTIPDVGGESLEKLFNINGHFADVTVYALSAGAGLCYTMFCYKTLEALKIKPSSAFGLALALLAPLPATCYLTGGVEGAALLPFLPNTGVIIFGSALYLFRIISCIDASNKFPDRLNEVMNSWNEAIKTKDYKELARLVVTCLSSIGYAIAVTDSIYLAVQTVLEWCTVEPAYASIASYVCATVGALGILPLSLYWIHRGLKQLTFGGSVNPDGTNPDPTDRYTYIGLLLGLPNVLGTLGAATSVSANMFARLGMPATITRVVTATIYAATAGTPGLATLLRSIHQSCASSNTHNTDHITPMLVNERLPLLANETSQVTFFKSHAEDNAKNSQQAQKRMRCSIM